MLRQLLSFGALGVFLLQAPSGTSQTTAQMQRMLVTGTANTHDTPSLHPLTWWTQNPLRLDEGRSLLFGIKAEDGHIIGARDYRFEQKVTALGTISGHRIVEIITTIHDRPSLVLATSKLADLPPSQPSEAVPPTQWKSLLVEADASDHYVEIYRLQAQYGTFQPMTSAIILGTGEDSILRTFDPDSGNGGGCSEGYWWFDKSGAHGVDFSPLDRAIASAQPPDTTAWPHCGALAPNNFELRVGVQRTDAKCHACDWLGEIVGTYEVKQGQATPVSIHFVPTPEQ